MAIVEAIRHSGDTVSVERRYYISTLDNNAQRLGQAVRGHGPENMAVLRHIALHLLQQDETTKAGMQTKRLKAGWDHKYLANVLAHYAAQQAVGLRVRHDHGSVYLSDDFQNELDFLGVESSPSFVRPPQGNGCVERFIGPLKENLLGVHTFFTVEELRCALIEFKQRYNEQWILQRHNYKTPAQVRQEKRRSQYEDAAR